MTGAKQVAGEADQFPLSAGMKGVGLWHDVEIHTEAQNTEIKKLCGFVS